MRFLNELPGKAWIDLHKKVFGSDGFNENFVLVKPHYCEKDTLLVYFKELDENGEMSETEYVFRDFYRPVCTSIWLERQDDIAAVEARFFTWMANRFGENYIRAYFEEHTGGHYVL